MVDKALFSSNSEEWETPQDLFDQLNETYKFNLDSCATDENAKCEVYFALPDTDGLIEPWCLFEDIGVIPGRVFCNPPYGRGTIDKWTKKAREEIENGNAELIVMLLPVRTCTRWFHEDVVPVADAVYFIRGRLKFGGAKNSAPFPSMVAVYTKEEE